MKKKNSILVTGASGFVGSILSKKLEESNFLVKKITKKNIYNKIFTYKKNFNYKTRWFSHLRDIEIVIHCANISKANNNSFQSFNEINNLSTINLAKQCIKSNVKIFIYLSSVKVFGEFAEKKIKYFNKKNPLSNYGVSKLNAEKGLKKIFNNKKFKLLIIQPPIIYGNGSTNNITKFVRFFKYIPFFICSPRENKRAFISINNLCDFIIHIIKNKNSLKNYEEFLISDNESISLEQLIKRISNIYKKKIFIFKLPVLLFNFFYNFSFSKNFLKKLYGSLDLDISRTIQRTNWRPKYKMLEELNKIKNFYE